MDKDQTKRHKHRHRKLLAAPPTKKSMKKLGCGPLADVPRSLLDWFTALSFLGSLDKQSRAVKAR